MTREQIEKAWKEHTLYNHSFEDDISLNEKQAFVKGAQWRINSVWHDASEAPEADKTVLVLFENVIGRYVYYELKSFKPIVIKNWEKNRECIALERVLYWAYIDDLLPERKEETNGGR